MTDIYTPNNNPVVTFLMCESSSSVRDFWDKEIARDWPDARQIKTYDEFSSTRKFNCHGYAWLRVEQNIDRWIGTEWYHLGDIVDPEKAYITDGSYTKVSQPTYPGKVFWASGDHSAVTTNVGGMYISKWNEWSLVEHAWNYSPYGTNNLEYYKIAPITGTDNTNIVCYDGITYTLNNPPSGTITWTVAAPFSFSSSSHVTSETGNPVTVYRTGNGSNSSTLTAKSGSTTIATRNVTPCQLEISGDNNNCGAYAYYSISGLPANITDNDVLWTYSGHFYPQSWGGNYGRSMSFRVLDNGNGAWVNAKIIPYNNMVLTKNFPDNFPNPMNYNSQVINCNHSFASFNLNPSTSGVNTYRWEVVGSADYYLSNTYGLSAYVELYGCGPDDYYYVLAYAVNSCGESSGPAHDYPFYSSYSGNSYFNAYPNPASNVLNIEINKAEYAQSRTSAQSLTDGKALKTAPTFDIRLYDGQGNLLRHAKAKDGSIQFNVSNLPNGIYYLHIYDGISEKPEMRQIVVEK